MSVAMNVTDITSIVMRMMAIVSIVMMMSMSMMVSWSMMMMMMMMVSISRYPCSLVEVTERLISPLS